MKTRITHDEAVAITGYHLKSVNFAVSDEAKIVHLRDAIGSANHMTPGNAKGAVLSSLFSALNRYRKANNARRREFERYAA